MSHAAPPRTRPLGELVGRRLVPGAALALSISAIQLLFMFCLSYPPLHAQPRDLPLGVVGPEAAVRQIGTTLAATGEDAFDVTRYSDADAARGAIEDRAVYGAIVVGSSGATVLVASAANASVATMLRSEAAALSPAGSVPVEDVVPASEDDPNGSGFLATVLPLTLLSLALGIGVALLEKRRLRTAGWIAMAATTTGTFASWIAHAMGTFTGSYWGTLCVVIMLVFGIAITSAGLTHCGRAGRAFDLCFALLLLCVGIPGAGAIVPSVFLVEPWRALGPLLPPGAAVDALRGINFFDGAATAGSLWVLIAWVAVGLTLILLSQVGSRQEGLRSVSSGPSVLHAPRV